MPRSRGHGLRMAMQNTLLIEPLTARVIQDIAAWEAIRPQWNRVHAASSMAGTSLDFVWLRSWWTVYASKYGAGGLRIITLWRGDVLVGALPLYIAQSAGALAARCLRFLSTGEEEYEEICPDYLDLLSLPGEEVACTRAVWAAIIAMEWDTLELLDMVRESALVRGHESLPSRLRIRLADRGTCPIANLEGGLDPYLMKLSSKTRMRARQEIRKAEQSGVALEMATQASAESHFQDLIRLHQARWIAEGKPGCFSAPRFTEFHRELVKAWLGSGRLLLARLSHAGEAFVVLYGFVTGGKFDLYQLGVGSVEGTRIHSPGMLANLLLMKHLSERGVTRYDFLRGSTAFKNSLTTEHRELVRLTGRRIGVRTSLDQASRLLVRVHRRINRLMSDLKRGAGP